jgi:hypothetical protein
MLHCDFAYSQSGKNILKKKKKKKQEEQEERKEKIIRK